MPGPTPMPKVSTLEVIETGARRRWTPEEKRRIVAESFSAPRVGSATARRHRLSTSQLYTWRRQVREGELIGENEEPGFVPAMWRRTGHGMRRLQRRNHHPMIL